MFSQLPSADQFLPHGSCLLWYPDLLMLHAGSDALIALSYYSIPAALGYVVLRRRDILFPWVFVLFAAFILACGTTHVLGIWTLWHPNYLLDGSVKLATALVSVGTAIILWRLMPDLLAIPSTAQLADANRELAREVAAHRAAEGRAERLATELEQRVAERTRELEQRTRELSAEIESRRRAEAQVTETSDRFRYLFMNNPLPMWVYDRTTLGFLEVNGAAIAVYGYSRDEFLAMTLMDIRPAEDVDRLLSALSTRGGSREAPGWRHQRKNGSLIHVDLFVHDIVFEGQPASLVSAVDVTARRAIQDQLHQAQKMEVIGQLTGGVAHDFNNLLTVVLGNAQMLEVLCDGNSEQNELCREIADSARRGADLTQRLLAFARRQTLSPASVDVTRLVFEMRALLARAVGETVRIDVLCEAEIWPAFADSAQLESALLNLVVNARDAMPKGGRIVIELRNETRTAPPAPGDTGPGPGDYVALGVADNGVGMTAEVLGRALEPFFTTKSTGRGSGLGLSMVYGFAQQSGGGITIASEPGRGTIATLLLPRAPASSDSVPAPAEPEAASPARGSETVLVVEDEAPVRRFVRRELERLGYRVLQASDGPSALRLLRTEIPIDLLFVDIIMPGGMNGLQVAATARALRPSLRVLLTSGYSDTVLEQQGADEPFGKPLQKPYQLRDLASAIRGKLDPAA